jgi:heptosyltransferase-1
MTWLIDGEPIESLLLTRLRYLGDVVMSTTLCEVLRAGDPDLRLGYLSEAGHGLVLAGHPLLDRVHLLRPGRRGSDAAARVRQSDHVAAAAVGTIAMVRELRRARYDVAVDLFFNPRSAWLLWLAGIGVRVGGTRKWRQRLYTHTVQRQDAAANIDGLDELAPGGLGEHLCRLAPLTHAETGLGLLAWAVANIAPGTLRPTLPAADRSPTAGRYLVLAPGATWPTKEWPDGHWRQLIAELAGLAAPPLKVLVPPGQEGRWAQLGRAFTTVQVEVLPAQSLLDVRDLLAGAAGLISVDGGVMHMGVALGTPTLALFGPTDPSIWFPYEQMGPYKVLARAPACHPCDRHTCDAFICLPELAVPEVRDAATALFGLAAGRNHGGES